MVTALISPVYQCRACGLESEGGGMKQPEYQRIAGQILELEARRPSPGSPDHQLLDLLRRRLQVHEAMACQEAAPPDTDGMVKILERVFRG
jgi:hypothetical protein